MTSSIVIGIVSFALLYFKHFECQEPTAQDNLRKVAGNAMRGDYDDTIRQLKKQFGPQIQPINRDNPNSNVPYYPPENNPYFKRPAAGAPPNSEEQDDYTPGPASLGPKSPGSKSPGSKSPAGGLGPVEKSPGSPAGGLSPVMQAPKSPPGALGASDPDDDEDGLYNPTNRQKPGNLKGADDPQGEEGEDDYDEGAKSPPRGDPSDRDQNLQDRDTDDDDDRGGRRRDDDGGRRRDDDEDGRRRDDDEDSDGKGDDKDGEGDEEEEEEGEGEGDEDPNVPYIVPPKLPKYKPKRILVPLGEFLKNRFKYGYTAAKYPYASNNPFMYGKGRGRSRGVQSRRRARTRLRGRRRGGGGGWGGK